MDVALALLVLAGVLGFAVARPRGLPEAVAAVEAAIRRIAERDRKPGETVVPTSLVLRGSTAPR